MSDDRNILQTIIDNPGIKTKEIARVTGLSRKYVYEALNGVLIENVISDDKVRWYPKINRKNSTGYPSQKTLQMRAMLFLRMYQDIKRIRKLRWHNDF